MKIPVLLIFICASTCAFSQKRTENFEITLPEQKITGSLYNTLQFLDSRYDTTYMGIVQLGALNTKARVMAKTPLSLQLAAVMNGLTDAAAKNGALLFQLRQCSFAELTGVTNEKGYFYLRADVYANKDGRYRHISAIDTVVTVKAFDVTKALFRNGSKTISAFIAASLLKDGYDTTYYSFNDVANIDSIEKQKIKAYTVSAFTDGLYSNFTSFMDQRPDRQATVDMKKGKVSLVKAVDEHGGTVKVKPEDVYALVYNGQPYIATDYGYYPVQKINGDFLFTGKAKVNARTGDVMIASMLFGVVGLLIASHADATFDMKIDHKNGGFIRLREVNAASQ